MRVFPAIDLKDGRCVRLRQGDMQQETRYSDDPSGMASHWESQGAQCLHVVDLNGAVDGHPQNLEHIAAIVEKVSIPVQVGGGIRNLDTVRDYLTRGIQWVVLGTAILDNPELLAQACTEFPSQILVGVDVKQGKVAVRGWTDVAEITPEDFLSSLTPYAIAGVVFTEISRDGMLAGPNIPALETAVSVSAFPVIASGGITRVEDIHAVKQLGEKISGIIIGKALYEGTLDLPTAIAAATS
ncbi:MAG: 1-(5-phosphoribosyl)-5-[(5-phosphoribosylamino)methylideneamino]imidazole-4-carboxamide isomerase [Nitrospirae bacterium]|nr:1-(5-phosphoribosyl)-5-[(5-phosphoribosylamino)methylideneamino]imidazole-4-carboxamide isomerase [Nitrospirota bacterium]